MRHRIFVDALGGEGVVDIGEGDDSRFERDLLAGDAVGIAAAVPSLVMSERDSGGHFDHGVVAELALDGDECFAADLGVFLHDSALFRIELSGLEENAVGDSDLADVVQGCGDAEAFDPLIGDFAELVAQLTGEER